MSSYYIAGPLVSDPMLLKQRMVDYLTSFMPTGWQLMPGNLDDLMLSAVAMVASEQADVANAMLDNAFRYFGKLVNVPPLDAAPSAALATFTVKDTVGYMIPRGTVVGITDSSGVLQGFDTVADLNVSAGATTAATTVMAETAGVVANGLSGTAQLVQASPFVTGASLALSSGGADAELDPVYMDRLAETLTLLSPRPLLAPNFAVLARSIPGVFRATAVDLLKPGPPWDATAEAANQEKDVTVAVTAQDGTSVGATVRANVTTFLQSLREQNFKVWVVDPNYGPIDVVCTVGAWTGWDLVDVRTRVIAALQAKLSPATWATDPTGNVARWANDPVVRLSELHNAVMVVQGVRYVTNMTFSLGAAAFPNLNANPSAEVDLSGISGSAGVTFTRDTAHLYTADGVNRTHAVKVVTPATGWTGVTYGNLNWNSGDTLSANVQVWGTSGNKVRIEFGDSTTLIVNEVTLAVTGWTLITATGPALAASGGSGWLQVDNGSSAAIETFWVGYAQVLSNGTAQSTQNVTLGRGSLVPALPTAGVMTVTAIATT